MLLSSNIKSAMKITGLCEGFIINELLRSYSFLLLEAFMARTVLDVGLYSLLIQWKPINWIMV